MRKEQFCPAQNILITPNQTTEQPYDQITRQFFTEKYPNFQVVQNFRFVKENIGEQLKSIALNKANYRKAALAVAKEDANFGEDITNDNNLSLQDRIKKTKNNQLKMKK